MTESCKPAERTETGDGDAKSDGCRGRCKRGHHPENPPAALSAAGQRPRKSNYERTKYGEARHRADGERASEI
jgi:hypothetical protein